MLSSRFKFARRGALGLVSTVAGIALTAAISGPASAVAPPSAPPTTPPPALSAFENQTSVGAATTAPASSAPGSSAVGSHFATPAALVGKRQTFTRGSALAWSSDTFEWYWNGSSITTSSAFQGSGYVFPNTVTLQGVTRTLAIPSQHNWRGTATIGTGVVTPWGAVDVYSSTITDYFSLTPGGGFTHTS
jgi:hypothetical protein